MMLQTKKYQRNQVEEHSNIRDLQLFPFTRRCFQIFMTGSSRVKTDKGVEEKKKGRRRSRLSLPELWIEIEALFSPVRSFSLFDLRPHPKRLRQTLEVLVELLQVLLPAGRRLLSYLSRSRWLRGEKHVLVLWRGGHWPPLGLTLLVRIDLSEPAFAAGRRRSRPGRCD